MIKKVKLGDICEVRGGYAFKSIDFQKQGIPVIRISNISDNSVLLDDKTVFVDSVSQDMLQKYSIHKGDILVALSGATTGKFGIYEEDTEALLNQRVAKLIPSNLINNLYLYYYLNTLRSIILQRAMGVAQPNISPKEIEDMIIFLPLLETQIKIAQILDQAQRLIDKRKEQIALLDELVQSVFYDMFGDPVLNKKGWKTRKLEEVAKINMGQSPKGDSYNTDGVGIPLLNGPAEFGKRFPIEKQWTVSPTKKCVPNDILFCVRGATVGKMNFADKEYCIGRGLAAIQPNVGISHEFLYFILKMNTPVLIASSNGSTFMNVKKEQLSNILVFDTPQILQNEFMEKVNKIDQQKELLNKSLAELETNFHSLMQRAFRGELVVE